MANGPNIFSNASCFTIVGGTAKHCVDRYGCVSLLFAAAATRLRRTGYTLGFAAHS